MDLINSDDIEPGPSLDVPALEEESQLDNSLLLADSQMDEAFLDTQIIQDEGPPPPLSTLPLHHQHHELETEPLEVTLEESVVVETQVIEEVEESQSHPHHQEDEEEVVVDGVSKVIQIEGVDDELQPLPQQPASSLEEKEAECEEAISCNCLQCQEEEGEGAVKVDDLTKVKCLVCYATISTDLEVPTGDVSMAETSLSTSCEDEVLATIPEASVEELLSKVDGVDSVDLQESTAAAAAIAMGVTDNKGSENNEAAQRAPKQSTAETATEEHPHINLPIIFQILNCCMDDVDLEKNAELVNTVPLCVPCHSVVTDAVVIYQELKKLEKTLGNLKDTIKDQIVQSFENNFCKKKKYTNEITNLLGQIDATRMVIVSDISDSITAAQIISSLKGSKKGGKRKKTIVSKAALYPQVTLEPLSRGRKRRKTKAQVKAEYDDSGVKKEYPSDHDENMDDGEYAYDEEVYPDEDDDEDEEQVTFLQTHSGRLVKKPNYKKWLLGDDEDDEEEEEVVDKPEGEEGDEVPESPKSEPEWSPGHTDEEYGGEEGDSDDDSSGDSEVDLDSEEDIVGKKRLRNIDELDEDYVGDEFEDLETGQKRARRKKQGNRVKCPECPRTFADEGRKDIHIKRKHTPGGEVQLYDCDKCAKKFRRPGLLRKHLEKQHGEIPEGGSIEDEGDRKKHMCDFCGQKYRNASELRIHVRLHTGETPYQCEHCDKSFVSSLKREFHIEQSHWEVPPLKCEFCSKAFFRQHRLRIHRISHTGEKAYLCEICSQSFSHPTYLKYHQGQHAELNLETFKCPDCGKVFANPTNLRLHKKTVHLKQFRFTCEVCAMGFTHMSHKRIHMRGHTGERPYKCELCGEAFRYRDRLRIHMRGHTGERPFVCELCKKGFASRSKLKRHEKIHEKNQPPRLQSVEEIEQAMRHRCDDCGKGFAEPQHLSAHRRYCQRKTAGEKEERKSNKANQSAKLRAAAATAPKIEQHPLHQAVPPQQPQMLVPVPVNYTYPVTYGYEVPQNYHQQPPSGVRDYPYN